ncbi:hypothetical protein DERP_007408 [Dermatophagoides pteronyssinus]|uniref:Uncharacterized protein n=1 Tax=Dermatophagoides pteronyssinus TaxID=6956 RepID=A0ABQ8J4D8_DERPT|nr:hypothetical protein DERP_007408 [Dermatophagoides pteronyssinus]
MNEFSIMNYGHDLMLLMITDDDDDDDDGGYMDIYGPEAMILLKDKIENPVVTFYRFVFFRHYSNLDLDFHG